MSVFPVYLGCIAHDPVVQAASGASQWRAISVLPEVRQRVEAVLNETYILIYLLTKLTVSVNPIHEKSMKNIWSFPVTYSLQILYKNIHSISVNDNNCPLLINYSQGSRYSGAQSFQSENFFLWLVYVITNRKGTCGTII